MILKALPAPLHRPLLVALVASALGTGAYLLGTEWLTHHEEVKGRLQSELQQMRAAVDVASKEAERNRTIAERFAALDLIPVEEGNTALRDTLLRLQQHEHLFSVRLEEAGANAIAPQHDRLPVVRLRQIRLQAELLHEDALNDALQLLSNIPGVRTVPLGCEINRLQTSTNAQLQVWCEFHWVSLHPRLRTPS